jgi:two-component system chemotaxis response regulator CheY
MKVEQSDCLICKKTSRLEATQDGENIYYCELCKQYHRWSFQTGIPIVKMSYSEKEIGITRIINVKPKTNIRSLVVEDEIVSRKKMVKVLESFGKCIAVETGEEGLKVINEHLFEKDPFNLIILDILMADIDGIRLLLHIRRVEELYNIPKEKQSKIVMVTSLSDESTVIACIQAGCDGYIIKPFNKEILTNKLIELGVIDADSVVKSLLIRQEELNNKVI